MRLETLAFAREDTRSQDFPGSPIRAWRSVAGSWVRVRREAIFKLLQFFKCAHFIFPASKTWLDPVQGLPPCRVLKDDGPAKGCSWCPRGCTENQEHLQGSSNRELRTPGG